MQRYLSDHEAAAAICEYGRRLYERGYVAANDGNITAKVGENAFWATPAGVSKGHMTPEMLVKVDAQGNVLQSGARGPSSELKMHLRVYQENPRVCAVVHAHPVTATAFSVLGEAIRPDSLSEALLLLGGEIPVAEFALPGTCEVPESIAKYCNTHDVVLLGNHGALAWGEDLETAYFRLDSLEHFCKIYLCTRYIMKVEHPIPPEQAQRILDGR